MLLNFGRHSVHLHSCTEGTLLGPNAGSKIKHYCIVLWFHLIIWDQEKDSAWSKRPGAGAPQPFWPSAQLHPDGNWCQTWLEERSCFRGTRLSYHVQGDRKNRSAVVRFAFYMVTRGGCLKRSNLSTSNYVKKYCKKSCEVTTGPTLNMWTAIFQNTKHDASLQLREPKQSVHFLLSLNILSYKDRAKRGYHDRLSKGSKKVKSQEGSLRFCREPLTFTEFCLDIRSSQTCATEGDQTVNHCQSIWSACCYTGPDNDKACRTDHDW